MLANRTKSCSMLNAFMLGNTDDRNFLCCCCWGLSVPRITAEIKRSTFLDCTRRVPVQSVQVYRRIIQSLVMVSRFAVSAISEKDAIRAARLGRSGTLLGRTFTA